MKNYYVIAGTQPYMGDPKSCYVNYYYGERNGGFYGGPDVRKARRFEWEEIIELMKRRSQLVQYGCSIVQIADVTFEALEQNEELVRNYNDPNYALRG